MFQMKLQLNVLLKFILRENTASEKAMKNSHFLVEVVGCIVENVTMLQNMCNNKCDNRNITVQHANFPSIEILHHHYFIICCEAAAE